MRPAVAIVALAALGAAFALRLTATRAEEETPVAKPAAPVKGPRLEFRENPVLFGTKYDDEYADVTIGLRNVGDETLHVNRLDVNCACARLGESPADIAPGKEAELKLRMRFTGMAGKTSRVVAVDSNDATAFLARVRIEGEVVPRLAIEPRLAELKPKSLDEETSADLEVKSNDGQSLDGLTVTSATREIAITTTPGANSIRVHVVAAPFDDDFRGSLVFRRGAYERIVPVLGVAARDVRIVPETLVTGLLRRGEPLEARIAVRDKVKWRVTAVESSRKDLSGEVVGGVLRIVVGKDAPAGAFEGAVTVVFEGARPERIRVPVTAFIRE